MPTPRGVKRSASKASSSASLASSIKKKRGVTQLEVPLAPKKRGRVVACGQGDVGQLGLGEDVVETTRYKFVSALGDTIVDVCAGGMHSVALDTDGKVWTFGCNDEGALGRATSADTEEGTPGTVSLPRKAIAITAGDSHSAALLEDGDVYAWGAFRDSHGSMGLVVQGRTGKPCREPVHINVGEPAADMASGGDHLVILTTSGAVFTMGCGEQGQLGRLSQRSASRDARQGFSALLVPSKVTLRGGARRVWAGYHATFALDSTGEKILAWGLNNYGQLGISGEKRKVALYSPTECDAFTTSEGWAQVACGQHHSLAVDSAGVCYSVGRCEYGRLGLGDRTGDAENLEAVPKLQGKKCISIAAGTSSSFAVADNGEIHAWGMGSEGQLGTGNTEDALEPALVTGAALHDRKPLRVSAGGQHSLILLGYTNEPESSSMAAEKETAVQKPEKKEKEKRPAKRQKVAEAEVSSTTSAAQVADVAEESAPPQKLNGSDEKPTPMDVDTCDKPEPVEEMEAQPAESKEPEAPKESSTPTEITEAKEPLQDSGTKVGDTAEPETKPEAVSNPAPEPKPEAKEEPKLIPEEPPTSEQPIAPAVPEKKSDVAEHKIEDNDIDMKEDNVLRETVNGSPDINVPDIIAEKIAEFAEKTKRSPEEIIIPTDTAVPTTA